jgi:hypothetical protein
MSEKPVAHTVEVAKSLIEKYNTLYAPKGLVWAVLENCTCVRIEYRTPRCPSMELTVQWLPSPQCVNDPDFLPCTTLGPSQTVSRVALSGTGSRASCIVVGATCGDLLHAHVCFACHVVFVVHMCARQ